MPVYSNADASANWTTDGATYMGFYVTLANGDFVLGPNGNGSFYLGPPADGTAVGGNARGTGAVDLQITRLNATNIASGTQSFAAGYRNTASGNYSTALGIACTASGTSSMAICSGSVASGSYSFAQSGTASGSSSASLANVGAVVSGVQAAALGGGNSDATALGAVTIAGDYSLSDGLYATSFGASARAIIPYSLAFAGKYTGPSNAQRGKSQANLIHLDQRTVGAVTAKMVSASSASSSIPILLDTVMSLTGTLVAWNETDETATSWAIDILYYFNGAAGTIVGGGGAQTIKHTDDLGVPVVSIALSGTLLDFNVTGLLNKTIRWSCALLAAQAGTT